jgi:hypothetical protein
MTKKIVVTKVEELNDTIAHVSEWIPLKDVRGHTVAKNISLSDTYGLAGCYQAVHLRDLNRNEYISLVDRRIGYTGKASNVFVRVQLMKRGKHSISAYNKKNFADPNEEICIRYIFPQPDVNYSDLERYIHNITETEFNQRFAWESGTSASEGKMYRALDSIDNLTTLEELKEVVKYAEEKAKELFISNWLED